MELSGSSRGINIEMDEAYHPTDIKDFEDYDKAEPFRKLAQ